MEWPIWWAAVATVVIFVVLLGLTWLVDRRSYVDDSAHLSTWRDLRIWASVLVALQLFIYYLFS